MEGKEREWWNNKQSIVISKTHMEPGRGQEELYNILNPPNCRNNKHVTLPLPKDYVNI